MSDPIVHEEWRPVVGLEEFFHVSNLGRVKSLAKFGRRRTDRILKPQLSRRGYCRVCLCANRRAKTNEIHRLVAKAFLGPAPAGHEINHKDGNKQNNSLANLEYVTHARNVRHAYATGLNPGTHGERINTAKLKEPEVLEIWRLLDNGVSRATVAACYGLSKEHIHLLAHKRIWKHLLTRPHGENALPRSA